MGKLAARRSGQVYAGAAPGRATEIHSSGSRARLANPDDPAISKRTYHGATSIVAPGSRSLAGMSHVITFALQ
jgi:hypothetical protein